MTKVKNQHFVPQHIQKAFASNDKGQVWCFDKKKEKAFQTSPSNILSETYFNDFNIKYEGKEFIVSSEEWCTKVEGTYQPALNKILDTEDLKSLSEHEFAGLLFLMPFQAFRTRTFRNMTETMRLDLVNQIKEKSPPGFDPATELDELRQLSEDQTKMFHLQMLREMVPEMVKVLLQKNIFLLKAPEGHNFILGDDPVVLHNDNKSNLLGNLGWEVKGIQIYMPISPRLILAAWCPSLSKIARQEIREISVHLINLSLTLGRRDALQYEAIRKKALADTTALKQLLKNISSGIPAIISPENVVFYNSLQILSASRFVISRSNNFQLARKMIADNAMNKFAHGNPLADHKLPKKPVVFENGEFQI